MEDLEPKEVHSGEMKVSSEKSIKRKYKTPGQIDALEKFYSEHKYPTEEMKLQFAEQAGLTEKQVSGWFCHRRLKDKRQEKVEACANGRQDHSSGVIQDHGSGLRQDSCGSTKQGDHLLVDPKEVESRSFQRQNSPPMNIIDEHRVQYMGNGARMDDTSSGSSSPLYDRFLTPRPESERMKSSKHLTRNGVNAPNDFSNKFVNVGYRPSGYLKVKRQTENVAITAVKRQLGEHYCEDGPPLGIEFDPLPPGAFESPSRDASQRPYYAEVPPGSPEIKRRWKVPYVTTRDTVYNPAHKERAPISAAEVHQDHHDYQSHRKSKENHSFHSQGVPYTGLNSPFDEQEDSAWHVSTYSGKKKYSISSKDKEEMVSSPCDQHYPSVRDSVTPKEHPFHDRAEILTEDVLRSEKSRLVAASKPKSRGRNYFDGEKNKPSKAEKEGKKYLEEMVATDHPERARIKKHPTKEIPAAKRVKTELPLQDYATKPSLQMHH